MDVVQTPQCPGVSPFTKDYEKVLNYREKYGVGASTACEKVNTVSTDENLFRFVPVPGHGARVLPLKLVPLPGHGAQIFARAKMGV